MKKLCFYTCGFVYDILVFPVLASVYTVSLLTPTLRRYVRNRSSFAKLKNLLHSHTGKDYTYFFCSSIGEFEQLIPLLSLFEKEHKSCYIFFHSQNGLEHARKLGYSNVTMTSFDYFSLWLRLFRISKPIACVISKHELWPGFILAALVYSRLFIVNVVPRSNHPWYTRAYRFMVFRCCTRVFFAEPGSSSLVNGTCTGDTRIDRIRQRSEDEQADIRQLDKELRLDERKILLIGNAYADDTEILAQALQKLADIGKTWVILLIPNRPENAAAMETILTNKKVGHLVRVIPVMGRLFQYYGCADLAWIGGGFRNGNHNALEAAFFGIPLISGPHLPLLPDARYLEERKVLSVIHNAQDFISYCSRTYQRPTAPLPVFASFPSLQIYQLMFE